tara:strand:- start:600 stop:1343 length:744 start_codon:yes stop_codon:yes gene_type:complete
MPKPTKVVVRRKKFFEIEVPLINKKIELVANNLEDLKNKTLKLDLTRQLRGKSVEATLKIDIEKEKPIIKPKKMVLMPYFIKRMIRKRTSYVEDSITTPTQESLVKIKPFLITRKKVSRAVRKTLRNLTKNWIEDYLAEKNDEELFEDILSNRLQKPLSLKLKKTYPLSLCEIRVLEIIRPLKSEEIPKKSKKVEKEIEKAEKQVEKTEKKVVEKAEKEIKKTQKKASKIQEKETKPKKEKKEDKKK